MLTSYPAKLLQLVSASVLEVCASAGRPEARELVAEGQKPFDDAQLFSASLGFSGEAMKGALVVVAPAGLLAATNPQREFVKSFLESDHADWIGEIANQVVGALKRQVAGYKVDFLLSTPTVFCGTGLQLAKQTKEFPATFWFDVAGQRLQVSLTATLAAGVSFEGEPDTAGQAVSGDTLLF